MIRVLIGVIIGMSIGTAVSFAQSGPMWMSTSAWIEQEQEGAIGQSFNRAYLMGTMDTVTTLLAYRSPASNVDLSQLNRAIEQCRIRNHLASADDLVNFSAIIMPTYDRDTIAAGALVYSLYKCGGAQ